MDLGGYFETVRRADWRVLLLDYDGTLAPFTANRNKAVPYPGIRELLGDILALPKTRTVIISGRAIKDLIELVGTDPLPEIWGSHGWEHLPVSGKHSIFPLDVQSEQKLLEGREVLASLKLPNLREDKQVSVAAHWRGLSSQQVDSIRAYVYREWSRIAKDSRLEIHPFDGGLELRPKGRNKGSAVVEVLSALDGTVASAYLGDDVTDEDAFRAMTGKGLRVLVRGTLRKTLADIWLKPPDELLSFLGDWKKVCTDA